jgi:hypothetical protein
MLKWLLIILAVTRVCAVDVPDGFVVETLATNLNATTALTVAPDGRISLLIKQGRCAYGKTDACCLGQPWT